MDTHVLGFLAAPDMQMSLRAVSLALLKVRAIVAPTAKPSGLSASSATWTPSEKRLRYETAPHAG